MSVFRNLVVAGIAATVLSGSVVAIGNDRPGGESDWVQVERENRPAIDGLQLGMSVDEVRSRMPHEPAFSEAFAVHDIPHRVLFYRTHRVEADGLTTRDETTPVVFVEGRLAGWGISALTGLPVDLSGPGVD